MTQQQDSSAVSPAIGTSSGKRPGSLQGKHRPVATASSADNPYLKGNFRPVAEELTVDTLKVTGTLPKELNGRLLRQGPNPAVDPGDNHHWFLGHGMIHAIHLEGGQARGYRNRWVRTRPLEQATGKQAAPNATPSLMLDIGISNVNVVGHAGKILSLGEVGYPYELDAGLNTLRESNYNGKLVGNMTAHPKFDPKTGEMIFFGYDFAPPFLRTHIANAQGELTRSVDIALPQSTMIHDFGVTASRIVIMDLPVVFDINLVAQGIKMPYRWDDTYQARVGVMSRQGDGSDMLWIDIEPCYVYHPLNSYDDGDNVVMDVVRHTRTFDQSRIGPDHEDLPTLHRWTINTKTRSMRDELINDRAQEFPRVNPNVECHRHRYGYTVEAAYGNSLEFGNLLKHDVQAGTVEVHEVGAGRHAGEGVFVPVSDNSGEDEGYVLSVVYDEATETSDVIVIDAQRFTDNPVATIHLPTRVPYGFHGNWIAG